MPELPEAETIARGLRAPLLGRSIEDVEVLKEDLLSVPKAEFRASLRHRSVHGVGRRGKNVVVEVGPGSARGGDVDRLVVNLGMSGRLLRRRPAEPAPLPGHTGLHFRLDDGSALIYRDVRRFGRLAVLPPDAYRDWSRGLGPEPLADGFRARHLIGALSRSRSPVRSWLLDQRRIAGVGNIYANEALAQARIHPGRAARDLSPDEGRTLHRVLRSVLREAIDAGGTTLRDYRTAEGSEGSYADALRVYGREGHPCTRCTGTIVRIRLGGRSAFLCPRCQPAGQQHDSRRTRPT